MSTIDTVPVNQELNIWYHTLNCGFRTRISGETDFPCIYGDRVGMGRSYVKLDGRLNYDAWCEGIQDGRAYVSDGRSHLMDYRVDEVEVGVNGSALTTKSPRKVRVTARVAARLDEERDPGFANRRHGGQPSHWQDRPYWHLEWRARATRGRSRSS